MNKLFCCYPITDTYLRKKTNDIALYSLKNKKFRAKIVSVYDGDTCNAVFLHNGKYVKYKIRMYGYDSPEIKPKLNIPNREDEIRKAKQARDILKDKILNKIVIVECLHWGKYGRLLATIYTSRCYRKNLNINEWMVNNNYGKKYFGKKKI